MYKLINNETVKRLHDGAYIPMNEENTDYCDFLKWMEEGNTPDPADINTPDRATQAKAELLKLENETKMNKGMREFFLVSMQDMAQRQSLQMEAQGVEMTPQAILAARPAWVQLVAINTEALKLEKEAGL